MGSAGLRAGDWNISGMLGYSICHFADRALVLAPHYEAKGRSPASLLGEQQSSDHAIAVSITQFVP
jgi:hypothetical protein